MNYRYSEIMYKSKRHQENDYYYVDKDECIKSNEICEYMEKEYPILCKTLYKQGVPGGPSNKIKQEIFAVELLYFCKLADKNIANEFKKLVQDEVDIVNEILKNESEWYYKADCSFYNKGDYKVTMIDYQNNTKKITGSFSFVQYSDFMYGIINDENLNIEESNRFYNTHYRQLHRLHKIIKRKKELLFEIYEFDNLQNYMDKEVLKVLAAELGVETNYCAYDFLVKNNKKSVVSKVKTKVKTLIGTK